MNDTVPECGTCKHARFGDFASVYGGSCQIPLPGPLQNIYHQNHTARRIKPTNSCAFYEQRESHSRGEK